MRSLSMVRLDAITYSPTVTQEEKFLFGAHGGESLILPIAGSILMVTLWINIARHFTRHFGQLTSVTARAYRLHFRKV